MGLSFGSLDTFMPNAFISEIKILDARDISGMPNPWGVTPDLAVEIEYPGKDGATFKQTIGGNFKKENDAVTGWGGAFPVQSLLEKSALFLSLKEQEKSDFLAVMECGKLPKKFLEFLKGKTIFKISYAAGNKEDDPTKLAYKTFNQLGWSKEALIKAFKNGVAKGYPKSYTPNAVAGPIDTNTEGDALFEPAMANEDVM